MFFPNVLAKLICEYDYYLEGKTKILTGHTDYISCVAVFSDDCKIISGSPDSTIKIWNVKTGKCEKTLKINEGYACCITVLSNGMIVVGLDNFTIKILDLQTGECLNTLIGHFKKVTYVAELPEGRIVTGSDDKIIRIWNSKTGELENTFEKN